MERASILMKLVLPASLVVQPENMPSTKVLYLLASNKYSGAEIVVRNLILANVESATSIIFCGEGELAQSFRDQGVKTIVTEYMPELGTKHVKSLLGILLRMVLILKNIYCYNKQMYSIIKANNIQVVHANAFIPSIYALPSVILAKFYSASPKFVWNHYDCSYAFNAKLNRLAYKINIWLYDLVLVPSVATKFFLGDHHKKIKVLYNGIRIEQKKQPTQREGHKVKIGIFGQICEEKGHFLLIKALAGLRARYDFELHVAGNFLGNDVKASLISRISDYGLSDRVIFRGFVTNMEALYNEIEVVINATTRKRGEPLGTTIIEGMVRGKIVIASNTGGSPEIITNEVDGFIFEPDDIESLNDNLEKVFLLSNVQRSEISEKAFNKIAQKFDIRDTVTRYNQLLLS